MKKETIIDSSKVAQSAVTCIKNDQIEKKEFSEVYVKPKKRTGIITNCFRLNVRKKPSIESEVIQMLDNKERISVDLEDTNGDWIKVFTSTGAEGYCMIDYIAVD